MGTISKWIKKPMFWILGLITLGLIWRLYRSRNGRFE